MSTALRVQVDNLRPLASIIADLSKQIAPEDLESRKQGSSTLVYISWHRALKYLDRYAPGWSYEVRDIYHLAGRVALVVRISIPCAEGVVYREATGQEDEEKSGYGDPTSNAESMALRRAAAKFGLGLYLYDKGKKAAPIPVRKPDTRDVPRLVPREPEPARTVKLEGAQPKSAVGPKTQEILNWMSEMGWNANDLANYIFGEFKLSVTDEDAVKAINALSLAQRGALHQKIKGEAEGRRS